MGQWDEQSNGAACIPMTPMAFMNGITNVPGVHLDMLCPADA